MRSDTKFARKLAEWQKREEKGFIPNSTMLGDFRERAAVSFSGHERDHLFLSDRGRRFTDVAGVSGLDSDSDGRAGAFLDYDRDGDIDIVVTSNNAPLLQLFRNNLVEERAATGRRDGRFIAFRFVGGSKTASPTKGLTNRNGYGARVMVHLPDAVLVREIQCGEGFAAQNSRTLHVGIGEAAAATKVVVRWPSGKTQELDGVESGKIVTCFEDPADSPDGSGVRFEPYHPADAGVAREGALRDHRPARKLDVVASSDGASPPLTVGLTMATWCAACREHMPQVKALRDAFSADEVRFVGLPVDPEDDPVKLRTYAEQQRPAYELLADLTDEQKSAVKDAVIDALEYEPLPSALFTDRAGNVVHATEGVPSVSEVRRLLRRVESR